MFLGNVDVLIEFEPGLGLLGTKIFLFRSCRYCTLLLGSGYTPVIVSFCLIYMDHIYVLTKFRVFI